jgi:hypothetical protein
VDHGSARQQLAVVVATIDAHEDAIDASPDVDGIVHDLVRTMIPDRSRAARIWSSEGAKRQEKADGRVRADLGSRQSLFEKRDFAGLLVTARPGLEPGHHDFQGMRLRP